MLIPSRLPDVLESFSSMTEDCRLTARMTSCHFVSQGPSLEFAVVSLHV